MTDTEPPPSRTLSDTWETGNAWALGTSTRTFLVAGNTGTVLSHDRFRGRPGLLDESILEN